MIAFLKNLKRSLVEMWYKSSGVNIHAVRRSRLVYALAYALELMLFACTQFMPIKAALFGLPSHTVLFVAHILCSLLVMLLWSDKFKPLIYASVGVMLLGFLGFVFLPDGVLRLIAGMFAMAGLGGAVTSARCGFAFAANNTERLIGMTLMFFSVAGIYYLSSASYASSLVATVLPLVLAVLLSVCLLLFKEKDFEVKKEFDKADARGLYWAFAFFIAYFAIDGYLWRLIDTSVTFNFTFLIIGMLIAGVVFFVLLLLCKLNVWHIWSLFFFCAPVMALLAVFAPQLGTAVPHYLFSGLSLIGWPLSIYMLACAQRRFASYALLKRCTLIYVLLSPLTTISSSVLKGVFPQSMPVVALIYILVVVFVFLVLSPYSYKYLFSAGWISDLHKGDMEKLLEKVEKVDQFQGYALTPRQREVAVLLLAAKTRRQISGELGLSESTVKMHTADLYKRLGINSRTELFRIFGVAEAAQDAASKTKGTPV